MNHGKNIEKLVNNVKNNLSRLGYRKFTMTIFHDVHELECNKNWSTTLDNLAKRYKYTSFNDYYYSKDEADAKVLIPAELLAKIIIDYSLEGQLTSILIGLKHKKEDDVRFISQHRKSTPSSRKQSLLTTLLDE